MPFETIADARPKWGLTADVTPDADNTGVLPFLINDLAVIRCPNAEELPATRLNRLDAAIESFFRGDDYGVVGAGGTTALTRGSEIARSDPVVSLPNLGDAISHAWVGDGFPVGAAKTTVASYYRQLQRPRNGRSRIAPT